MPTVVLLISSTYELWDSGGTSMGGRAMSARIHVCAHSQAGQQIAQGSNGT